MAVPNGGKRFEKEKTNGKRLENSIVHRMDNDRYIY